MIPVLSQIYPYTGNGLGGLPDAISCKVTHEINGIYELSMQYPVTGLHYSEIIPNRFLEAAPDFQTAAQPFRIYRITKPLNGVVTVFARHIAYDMSGIIIKPFTASTLANALTTVPTEALPNMQGFTLASPRTVSSSMEIVEPRTLWKLLGGEQGSFLDVYGGEWDFDKKTATLRTRLGQDNGVTIEYAKNLTKLDAETDISSTYGGVFPYWYSEEEGYVAPSSAVVIVGSPYSRILLLDCSETFETKPTVAQLQTKANAYITANSVGSPKESWKVNMAMLSESPEYAGKGILDQVALGDTVTVKYTELGVNATARVVKTEWDALKEKYITITIGRVKSNLASIIVGQNREVENQIKATKSDLETAIDNATKFITNGAGYMRLIYDANDELTEIVSLDNPDISLATNVWRWNNGGFGFSSNGYGGPYGLAMTQNGEIVADYITTGTLNAQRVKAGILSDTQNKNSWDLDSGAFTITNGTINITTTSGTQDVIHLTYGTRSSWITPSGFSTIDSSNSANTIISSTGMSSYDPSGMVEINGLNHSLSALDYSSNKQTIINPNGVELWSSTTRGVHIVPNPYAGTDAHGNIYLRNGTANKDVVELGDNTIAGRLKLTNDGDAAYTFLNPSGLTFYDTSGTATATYSADPTTLLSGNGLRLQYLADTAWDTVNTSGTTKTYTIQAGIYLLCTARYASSSTTQDGLWIVSGYPSGTSHLTPILAPSGGTTASVSGGTLTVTTGSAYVRISLFRIT